MNLFTIGLDLIRLSASSHMCELRKDFSFRLSLASLCGIPREFPELLSQ